MAEVLTLYPNVFFVLLPHDYRTKEFGEGDHQLAESIFNHLPKDVKERTVFSSEQLHASEIKLICKQLDLVISGRMHLAIASLGAGTPVGCISYQDKFEGLFRHFEFSEEAVTINSNTALSEIELVKFINEMIRNISNYKEHIAKELPRVIKLSNSNLL